MTVVDIGETGAQTKACVHICNYLFEIYKEINLSCVPSSLSHRDNHHVSDIYCTNPQNRVVSLDVT